jgi:hypothetical protein
MPKHEAMAQISRPFQIALVTVVLLAGVWLFALQGRVTSTGGSGSSAAVSSTPRPTHIARSHTVTSAKAATPRSSSTHAAVPSPSHKVSSSAHPATKTATRAATKTPTRTATKTPAKTPTKTPTATSHNGANASSTATLAGQHAVEADLTKGDVVVLLFWNPSGTDDVSVHHAVQAVRGLHQVAVQEASANQVASFGSVTRGVQVYATPTIFVIGKRGKAVVLNGVQDAFSIEQAISEARSS